MPGRSQLDTLRNLNPHRVSRAAFASMASMNPHYSEYNRWFHEEILPHEKMLRGWLRGKVSDPFDIDDIVQEAFMRVVKIRKDRDLEYPKAILFTVARNLVVDRARKSRPHLIKSFTDLEASDVIDEGEDIPELVCKEQEMQLLSDAINSLPTKCAEIFVMKRLQGLKQKEIASRLGISENTVNTQLKIGIRKCEEYIIKRS